MTLSPGIQRKLTTILAADAANYSGRMARNEVGTVTALRQARAHIDQTITTRGGRIANTSGDGLIAEFPSVVEAVGAAVAIQRKLNASDDGLAFRIGLHLGDVIVEGEDLLGDGVNLAARLQESAPEGGIIASQQVVDQAQGRLDAQFQLMRARSLKNMPGDFAIYGIAADGVVGIDNVQDVLPIAGAPQDAPMDQDLSEMPAPEAEQALKRYQRTRRFSLIFGGILLGLDLLTGFGTFWSIWPLAVLGYLVYRRRNAVPKQLLFKTGL